tara:strand:- start:1546 stop:1995 length:450 start_codon:yes stop_codon:yes gene_type:complete
VRTGLVVVFVAVVASAAVLVPRWLEQNSGNEKVAPKPCLLDSQDCRWIANGNDWQISLSREAESRKMTFTVTTSAAPARLLAVLTGESMYMGEYPVPLTKTAKGTYQAKFNLPVCTTDPDMRWQINLKASGENVTSDAVMPVLDAHYRP